MSIGNDENEEAASVYFRRNVLKVYDKVRAVRDALDMFLKGVSHTGDHDGQSQTNDD